MIFIIKYKIDNNFIEGNTYQIKFDNTKCVAMKSLDSSDVESLLEFINGEIINVKYEGLSKLDNLCIFSLNKNQISRESKLNKIL